MPLIQRSLARFFHRREDKFLVGIQELDARDLVEVSYSTTTMDHTEQTARQLAEEMANAEDEVNEYKQMRLPI